MLRKPFEHEGERLEDRPEQKSIFELPRMECNPKSDPGVYARGESCKFAGQLLFREALAREKNESGGERQDLKKALNEKDVELKGLYGKKEELGRTREDLAKRFEDFREAEKVLGFALEPFQNERRDLLLSALDHDLNPQRKDTEPLKPEEKERNRKILKELDDRTAEEKRPAMHIAAFVHLKQEKIDEAENQLNGTRKQKVDSEINVAVHERNVIELLDTSPGLTNRLVGILSERRMNDSEKVRAIRNEFLALKDPEQRETINGLSGALAQHVVDSEDFQTRILEGEKSLRTDREAIAQAQGLAESEKAIAQIPKEEGARRGQEALERQEIPTGERTA